jgi:ParB family chromosome partitioning protein
LEEIPVLAIRPNPNQPRIVFDDEALGTLTDSIKAVGVLQPVLVRPDGGAGYELIAGERRWRAAQRAGLATIPAVVRTVEDSTSLEHALIENLHRQDLNPLEEAAAYQQLISDFGFTHEEIGQRVGRSRSAVTNSLRLLLLPAPVHSLLMNGTLTAGHGRALLGLSEPEAQVALAGEVARKGLSVRATEEMVSRRLGEGAPAEREPVRREESRSAALLEVESSLGDYLNTRVGVQASGGPTATRGRIVVEFASMEDLGRLWRLIVGQSGGG